MEEKTIKVEEIKAKETKEGKKYHILRADGEGYFDWEASLVEGVKEGDTVTIMYTPGKYPKIEELGRGATMKQTTMPDHNGDTESVDRQQSIHRSVALKEANTFIQAFRAVDAVKSIGTLAKEVVKVAGVFDTYLNKNDEPDDEPKEESP